MSTVIESENKTTMEFTITPNRASTSTFVDTACFLLGLFLFINNGYVYLLDCIYIKQSIKNRWFVGFFSFCMVKTWIILTSLEDCLRHKLKNHLSVRKGQRTNRLQIQLKIGHSTLHNTQTHGLVHFFF